MNFAKEHDGDTFGIVNMIGNGIHDVAVYATESMLINVALQLGSRHIYTSYIFGYQPGDARGAATALRQQRYHCGAFHRGTRRIGYGLGIGYRQPLDLGPVRFLAIEALTPSGIDLGLLRPRSNTPLLASTRAVVGIQVVREAVGHRRHLRQRGHRPRTTRISTSAPASSRAYSKSGSTTVRHYPGLLLGMQI